MNWGGLWKVLLVVGALVGMAVVANVISGLEQSKRAERERAALAIPVFVDCNSLVFQRNDQRVVTVVTVEPPLDHATCGGSTIMFEMRSGRRPRGVRTVEGSIYRAGPGTFVTLTDTVIRE